MANSGFSLQRYLNNRFKPVVVFDASEFQRNLELLAVLNGKMLGFLIRQQAGLFCKDMMRYQPPFSGNGPSNSGNNGMDNAAKQRGQKSVERDIKKIFVPLAYASPSEVAESNNAGIFHAWLMAKEKQFGPHKESSYIFDLMQKRQGFVLGGSDFERFKELVKGKTTKRRFTFLAGTNDSDIKRIHEQERGSPSYKVVENKAKKVYVDDYTVVDRYIKKTQMRVGKLKSGWYFAGKKLPVSMPKIGWVEGQGSNTMNFEDNTISGFRPSITFGSKVGGRYKNGRSLMMAALKHRQYSLNNTLSNFISHYKNWGKDGVKGFIKNAVKEYQKSLTSES